MYKIDEIEYEFKRSFMSLALVHATHDIINGGEKKLEHYIVSKQDAICLTLFDENTDEFIFVRQFRTGPAMHKTETNPWLIEPVAGHIDPNEDPAFTAHREGEEETNVKIDPESIQFMCKGYTTPGCLTEMHLHYFAKVDSSRFNYEESHGIDDEDIQVIKISRKKTMEMIASGEIRACNTILGVSMAIAKGLVPAI